MTTQTWSTFLDQSSDAAFRVWGSEFNTKLAACGMVQTGDTGQINWASATRAGANTAAGYEIWRLSSSNLYFKIEYGSGTSSSVPSHWFTVGTGSNGSGTLTGQLSTRSQASFTNSTVTSTVTNYTSYMCATANYFGVSWKIASAGTANQARLLFCAMQTVDSTGTATSVGFLTVFRNVNNVASQAVATTAGVSGASINANQFFLPGNSSNPPANSLDGSGNNQALLAWHNIIGTVSMTPALHVGLVLATDLSLGNTASMTLVGTTAHTYLNASNTIAQDAAAIIAAANLGFVMLFE